MIDMAIEDLQLLIIQSVLIANIITGAIILFVKSLKQESIYWKQKRIKDNQIENKLNQIIKNQTKKD